MPRLEILDPDLPGKFEIQEDLTTIGRRPENVIVLTGSTVSGKHAEIRRSDQSYVLTDVGSRNGTHVNMSEIKGPVALHHNDEIHFGSTHARFLNPTSMETVHGGRKTVHGGGTVIMEGEEGTQTGDMGGPRFLTDDRHSKIDSSIQVGTGFGLLDSNASKKLKAVLEISQRLAGNHDLDAILPTILKTLFELFPFADRGFVLLREEDGELRPHAMLHRRESEDATIRLSRTIINRVLEEKAGVISADAVHDSQFNDSESIVDLKIRSIMCVPMLSLEGEPIGIISIDSQNQLGKFTSEDLDLLVAVAGQAALAYENARLFRSFLEKEKQDTELEIARSVQIGLLPETMEPIGEYSFFATYDSARAVGGDYYDFFHLPSGKICVSLGDVAGKGVPGALVMSRMHSCVQSTLLHVNEVEAAINAINEHMCRNSMNGRFVTYVLAILDPETNVLTIANAGHPSPIIRRADGSLEEFDEELFGPPIGVVDDWEFEAESKSLNPGDTVVIVTDGVDEAMNEAGELYGKERTELTIKSGPVEPRGLAQNLLNEVRKHADGYAQSDDITIFAFGRRNATRETLPSK